MFRESRRDKEFALVKAHALELLSSSGAFKMFPAFSSYYGDKEELYEYIEKLKYDNVIREVPQDCLDHNRVFTLAD